MPYVSTSSFKPSLIQAKKKKEEVIQLNQAYFKILGGIATFIDHGKKEKNPHTHQISLEP